MICERCGRPVFHSGGTEYPPGPNDYILIDHGYYGCNTGCCGLEAILVRPTGGRRIEFSFAHDMSELMHWIMLDYPDTPVKTNCWYCYEWEEGQCGN